MFGRQLRWRRLTGTATGRLVTLAIDHGSAYRFDLPPPLADIEETVARFRSDRAEDLPDAIVAQRGSFGRVLEPFAGRVPLMLQAISLVPDRPDDPFFVAGVGDAIALGADAIAISISVGGKRQRRGLEMVGRLVSEARPVGLPVVAHVYPFGKEFAGDPFSERGVAYAARAGFEAGADMVKVHYTGDPESFGRIVARTPVPVVAAGGPKLDSALEVLSMARDVVAAGAAGITVGRNLWGDPRPRELLRALRAVVHGGVEPEAAYEEYRGGGPR